MAVPAAAVLDTSVLLRLLHDHGDTEQAVVDRLAQDWLAERFSGVLLDLTVYECLNVAVRRLGFSAERASAVAEDIYALGAPIVAVDRELAVTTARLAADLGLSGYDAAFVAAARGLGLPLLTADRRLHDRAGGTALLLADLR